MKNYALKKHNYAPKKHNFSFFGSCFIWELFVFEYEFHEKA